MNRDGLLEMEREFSRRGFFGLIGKGLVLGSALAQVAPLASAAIRTARPDMAKALAVYSAIGNIVIPVDEDPGWATFDPEISSYGLNTFVYQIFLANNNIAFDAYLETLVFLDSFPVRQGTNTNFLRMGNAQQTQYLTDILAGNFENDGWQEVLNLAVNASVVSAKTVFFSNYPRHLAVPGAEFQTPINPAVRTGWAQMGLKGPVGPAEEAALRQRFTGIKELPGVDTRNRWI